jgi:hypothetical protein
MKPNPEAVLDAWMQGINRKDVPGLLALYDERAVLIPTFSNRLLRTPAALKDYFERLGSREQLSIELHRSTLIVEPVEGTLASVCGIYLWRFAIDSELFNFEARFSYLIDHARARPILQHHSSQIPRML